MKGKLGYEPTSRNTNYTAPYLERSEKYKVPLYLDFSFIFIAPKPRYERIISQRDGLGRIIHSRPPQL